MVAWILVHPYQISALLHHLDDFITAGPPDSPQCAHNLRTALTVCKWLGLPLHPGKCEGPATVLVILGIELDSVNQVARLPAEKLLALQSLISLWLPSKWCSRHELESLIGHLHHAAKVVLAWQNLLTSYDRPFVLFPQERSSNSSQQRVPPRLALVASVFVPVAWC